MNKCRAVLKYQITQHNYITLGLNQGPVDQQSNALPLSYIPMNIVTNNTT